VETGSAAPQGGAARKREVVLAEIFANAECMVALPVKRLHEKPTRVFEHPPLNNDNTFQFGLHQFHLFLGTEISLHFKKGLMAPLSSSPVSTAQDRSP